MYTVETRVTGKSVVRARNLTQAIKIALQDCSVTGSEVNIWNDESGRLSSVVKKDRTRFLIIRFVRGIGTTYVLSKDGMIGKKV